MAYFIGEMAIGCTVLEDNTRIISHRGIAKALGSRGGAHWRRLKLSLEEGGANLPVFVSAQQLKPFIDKELEMALIKPIPFRFKGAIAYGVKADLVPKICSVWLEARDAGALRERQKPVARRAENATGNADYGSRDYKKSA